MHLDASLSRSEFSPWTEFQTKTYSAAIKGIDHIVNIEPDCIFLPTAKELDELQGRKIIKDSSSNLPNELINTFKEAGFVDACKDSKLVLINPSNDDIGKLTTSLEDSLMIGDMGKVDPTYIPR